MKFLLVVAAVLAVALFAAFGTLSPCGMLREAERRQDNLAAVLPDAVVDFALAAKYGSLTPGKCAGLLLAKFDRSSPTPIPTAVRQAEATAAQTPIPNPFAVALQHADAVMRECRAKRIRGELKTYVDSAQCSNPRVQEAFKRARYRYMDLVELMLAKRLSLAKQIDQGQITEAQAAVESQNLMTHIAEMERSRDAARN